MDNKLYFLMFFAIGILIIYLIKPYPKILFNAKEI